MPEALPESKPTASRHRIKPSRKQSRRWSNYRSKKQPFQWNGCFFTVPLVPLSGKSRVPAPSLLLSAFGGLSVCSSISGPPIYSFPSDERATIPHAPHRKMALNRSPMPAAARLTVCNPAPPHGAAIPAWPSAHSIPEVFSPALPCCRR